MRKIHTLTFLFLLAASFASAQYTEIPDSNFEQRLIDQGVDSEGILDGRILTSDAATTETLILDSTFLPNALKITNLTGIEAFTVLRVLRCQGNLLIQLDVSQNMNLEELWCLNNNLTSLDVSNNTQLTSLYCNNNELTRLDVSNNDSLLVLRCQANQITTLDVTNISGLTELRFNDNNMRLNLDLSQNPSLTTLTGTSNPDLLCIQVADAPGADAGAGIYGTWSKDATAVYSENCEAQFPTTAIPDSNFEDALIALGHDDAQDNRVLTANISGLAALDVSGENISDLTGIEDFAALSDLRVSDNNLIVFDVTQNTNLETLHCNNNNLVSLNVVGLNGLRDLNCSNNFSLNVVDVTQNSALEILNCSNNINLGSIDVTQNMDLEVLNCSNSGITVLDISSNPFLLELYANFNQIATLDTSLNAGLQIIQCTNNQITSLDVTSNTLLTELFCSDNRLEGMLNLTQNSFLSNFNTTANTSLYCIQVADAISADSGGGIYATWNKDAFAVYSETCSDIVTHIPDDAFEQHLIDQGFDTDLDNYVLTVNIEGLTSLNASSLGIADLTGIEDFVALEELYCSDNVLTSLDISQNTLLLVLECTDNQLAELTLNTVLVSLICDNNELTSLDISQNPDLITLFCSNNQLSTLNVSASTNITHLNCSSNDLTNLNLGPNTNLFVLNASDNDLGTIDVTQNTGLTTLLVNDNLLAPGLDLRNQSLLTTFNSTNNVNLVCIEVADASAATAGVGIYATWLVDILTTYVDSGACALSSDEFEVLKKAVKVYPNPARENIFIATPNDITVEHIILYDIQGKRVLQAETVKGGINVTGLRNGLYFMAIRTRDHTINKKVIISR